MPVSAPNIEPSPALPSPSNQVPPAEAPAAPNITYGTIVAKNVWPDPFFRILRSQSGVEYVLHQEDRPANQYLSLGHTVGFTSSGEYLESPRGMLLRATQVSQINSPIDLAKAPPIQGTILAGDSKMVNIGVDFMKGEKHDFVRVLLASLSPTSKVPTRAALVKFYTYTKLKDGKQYLQVYHIEVDEEAEREKSLFDRSFVLPLAKFTNPSPNLLIGNFDEGYEGNALIMDCHDITLFFRDHSLHTTDAWEIVKFLSAKYHRRKEGLNRVSTVHMEEVHRNIHSLKLKAAEDSDRIARRLLTNPSEGLRIFINALAWGKDEFRNGQWAPRDWARWASRQFESPTIQHVKSVDMTKLVPQGTTRELAYQLGGVEDIAQDLDSINHMHDFSIIGKGGMVHFGSVHPASPVPEVNYTYGDNLHAALVLHFLPEKVWTGPNHPYPYSNTDMFYHELKGEGKPYLDLKESELDDSSSSREIRGRKTGSLTSVIFQVYVGKEGGGEANLQVIEDYRSTCAVERITTDLVEWRTYFIELDSEQEVSEFIIYYNHLNRKGVYTAMSSALFYSDWSSPEDPGSKVASTSIFNITTPVTNVNPGALQALLPGIQVSITGTNTLRCVSSHRHDFIIKELKKANNERKHSSLRSDTVKPKYIAFNSVSGDSWLVESDHSDSAKAWSRPDPNVSQLLHARAQIHSSMISHAPSVIENVPKGMAPSEVIRLITHFSDGSNDYIDSAMWGLSKNERPLLIINKLAYAKALKDPIKIEVNGHMRTLTVVEFDHTFHERTGNKVVDDTEQSVPSRSVIARRRSFSSHLEEPPKKFSKGISEAIAQCKSRDARPPIPPPKVVAFEQEPEVEASTGHVSSVADREEKEEPEREVAAEPEQPFRVVTPRKRRTKSKTANTTQSKTPNTNQPPTTPPNSSPRPSAPNYTPISQEVGGAFSPLGGLLDGNDEQDAYDAQEETVQGTITEVDEPTESSPVSPLHINLISDSPSQSTSPSPVVTRQRPRITRSKNCASSQDTDSEGGAEQWRSGRRNVPVTPSQKNKSSSTPKPSKSSSSKTVPPPSLKRTHDCDFCSLINAKCTERCASCKKQVCTRPKCGAKVSGNRHCLSCAKLETGVPHRTRSQTPQKKNTTGSSKQGKRQDQSN